MTGQANKPVGIYRKHGVLGLPNGVRIRNVSGAELDIPEQRYRNNGYEPPFEDLPWRKVYEGCPNADTSDA